MDRKAFLEQVGKTFEANPTADKFFVTSDGLCFAHEGVARNHAKMMGPHGGGVETITRESLERLKAGKTAKEARKEAEGASVQEEDATAENGAENAQEPGSEEENGGGAAAGDENANAEGDQPGQQAAATAAKKAAKAAPRKTGKTAPKKTTKKK